MQVDFIFQIAILIMSVVVHEVSHGFAANSLGDPTAKYDGRLTLNPAKHLDPVGSFLVPAISYFAGGFIFGWARPVPYNPHNLRPGRLSEPLVAAAGPASNIVIALIFGAILRVATSGGYATPAFVEITSLVIFINVLLAIFNLMPIPPLDGSKLLFALFPESLYKMRYAFERYGLILVILFIFVIWQFVSPVVFWLFGLISGISLI
ncbi:MAG: site-2 protease family protein [Parcubacteria group bacterium]